MGGITSKEKFEKEPIASNEKENKVAKRGAKETVAGLADCFMLYKAIRGM
jgi:hypothetical protein